MWNFPPIYLREQIRKTGVFLPIGFRATLAVRDSGRCYELVIALLLLLCYELAVLPQFRISPYPILHPHAGQ
jgi:hypothetical protein